MNHELKERLFKVCEEVSTDVENDIRAFEGKPFDGKTVAKLFGYQAAAIKALSTVLQTILKEENKIEIKDETKSRCCGLCDGVNDLCVSDMHCEEHHELGCEICFGKR